MPFDVISNVDYRYSSIKIDKFQYVCIYGISMYVSMYVFINILAVVPSAAWDFLYLKNLALT